MPEGPRLTRVEAGGDGRRPAALVAVVGAAIVIALWKPWAAAPTAFASPGTVAREAAATAEAATATPGPDLMAISDAPSCLGVRAWVAVSDVVSGGTLSRTWSRVDPVAASGPTDPGIPRIPVVGEEVLRLGFRAPLGAGGTPAPGDAAAPGAAAGGETPAPMALSWSTWRLSAATAGPPVAEPVTPVAVGLGSGDPNGMLFAAPVRRADAAEGWPPGTYVFRVTGPAGGAGATWFAADVVGRWRGPGASPLP